MSLARTISLATASLALAASAHAAGDFAFDYTYDRDELASIAGAERVFEDLHDQIEDECRFSAFTQRFTLARKVTEQCVAETLEEAVQDIDAPHLNAVFEAWDAGSV
ncbi:MAG: UrcA family protein [Pseudomonadota bacterium]